MTVEQRLHAAQQTHLLDYAARLSESDRSVLMAYLAALPLEQWPTWMERLHTTQTEDLGPLSPPKCYPPEPVNATHFRAVGEAAIRRGAVAALLVAGGQGTRLGYDGPKGEYVVTPLSHRSLFAHFAAQLRATNLRYGVQTTWCIMTSPLNDMQTQAYFREHEHFGLNPSDILFFTQGVIPTLDTEGRILLKDATTPATHPDGHGGIFTALAHSGILDVLQARGIEQLSYFQVDNPATLIIDPLFIGVHLAAPDSSAQMSSKMVVKRYPEERVGILAEVNGCLQVVEYSNLPTALAEQRDDDGGLVYAAGNVAVHLIATDFAAEVTQNLPLHRAQKRCAFLNLDTSKIVEPLVANALKLERFVFDALGRCQASVVLEVDRTEAFAPVKNAQGNDSPATSTALQIEWAARWLETVGVTVPRTAKGCPDCVLEIRPETALTARDLVRSALPPSITQGAHVLL